jgi:uncharacterized protein YggE
VVTGTGLVSAEPDFAVLDLSVESRARALGEARKDNDQKSASVLKATREFRVDAKDVHTSEISVWIQDKYVKEKEEAIEAYTYRKGFRVVVRDFKSFDQVFNGLLDAGVNRVNQVEFDTTRRKEFEAQAREIAVKSARAKAEATAKTFGQTLGEPLNISVDDAGLGYMAGGVGGYNFNIYNEVPPQRDPTIAGGRIRIEARVTVTYALIDEKGVPKPGASRR